MTSMKLAVLNRCRVMEPEVRSCMKYGAKLSLDLHLLGRCNFGSVARRDAEMRSAFLCAIFSRSVAEIGADSMNATAGAVGW